MVTVYGFPRTRATRITWMLEELQQPYSYVVVDVLKGEGRATDYLAINPAGKVPALRDGDLVLCESGAIVTYLGDKFGHRQLVPEAGTAMRGKYDQWCYFALCELEQPLWTMAKHKFALPAPQRVKAIFPTATWEFMRALEVFSEGLGDNHYILGENFSAADILLCHTLFWAAGYEQLPPQENLQNYLQRIRSRPALQQAMQREKTATTQ